MEKENIMAQIGRFYELRNAIQRGEINPQSLVEVDWEMEEEYEEEDIPDPTVLFVEPGKTINLMEETEATLALPWENDEQSLLFLPVDDNLVAFYSEETALETEEVILVYGPFFFATYDWETDEVVELTAKDLWTAEKYIIANERLIIDNDGKNIPAIALEY